MKIFELILGILAAVYILLGIPYVPWFSEIPTSFGMWALTLSTAAIYVILSKTKKNSYPMGGLAANLWLMAFVLSGIQFLGGLEIPQNLVPLIIWVALQSLLADPMHTLCGLLLLLASTGVRIANGFFEVLPGCPRLDAAEFEACILPTISQVLMVTLVGLLLLGIRRYSQKIPAPVPDSVKPRKEGVHPAPPPRAKIEEPKTETSFKTLQDSGIFSSPLGEDPTASQFFTRSYIENQGALDSKDKQGALDEVVYFMSKNFKAYTSVGFLLDSATGRLKVNAVVTRSEHFKHDCVIAPGQGLIGTAFEKASGLVTGNLKSYPEKLEYYFDSESINSVMAMRVVDTATKQIQGLLVVDSETGRAFSDEHKKLMDRFANLASAMITATNMRIQMNRYALQAESQYEIARNLAEALHSEDVMKVMIESLQHIFEPDRIVVCGYNEKTGKGFIWKLWGDPGKVVLGMEFDIQEPRSLYGSIFRNRSANVVAGFRAEDRYLRFGPGEVRERPEDILLSPILDDQQSFYGVVGVESDRPGIYSQPELQTLKTIMANVTNALTKARLYQEMENQATLDGLTQIPNHRKFQDFISMETDRCQRYKLPLTLLLLDIDHFKQFNDTYGHPVGDLVLKSVANTLTQKIRGSDFCARYGGEEFVVALIQADETQSRILAERIREAVEQMSVESGGKFLKVTLSVGCACFPTDGVTKRELIDNADKAMYYSKKSGRNRVTFFSQLPNAGAPL